MRQEHSNAGQARTRAIWGLLLLCWVLVGVLSAGAPLIELPHVRRPVPPSAPAGYLWRVFAGQLAIWLAWGAGAPVVLWLRRRFALDRWRGISAHVLAVCLLCLVHAGIAIGLARALWESGLPLPPAGIRLTAIWLRDLPFCALVYGLVLGIDSALEYYRQFRDRELRASQLEAQLAQAELQMLKMQLHPHFLFNTLNGITGMVRDNDNGAAVRMLVGLSDLLRRTLENSGRQEVRLSEELEWLELYLELQQARFSDRLQVHIAAAPEALNMLVPNLIVQPLVENAIRHGLAGRAAPGTVSLSADLVSGRLELRIRDDGVGLPENWRREDGTGLGLANTASRLRQLYADEHRLEVRNRAGGGVEAFLSIPARNGGTT